MSESKVPVPQFQPISEEQIQRIAGGECTPQEIIQVFGDLKQAYDNLVDFTSYVIERVATSTTTE